MKHRNRSTAQRVARPAPGGLALAFLALTGCLAEDAPADSAARGPVSVQGRSGALIGGFDANSPKLNAVGSISILRGGTTLPGLSPSTNIDTQPVAGAPGDDLDASLGAPAEPALDLSLVCSGALLNPTTAVTAKHCIQAFRSAAERQAVLVFALGPDSAKPLDYAQVISVEGAPGDDHGFTDNGHDVAVLHLQHPLRAPTVKLAAPEPALIGQSFAGIGFGQASNGGDEQTRHVGALTLRALEGKTLELLYGDFETYFHEAYGMTVPTDCPASAANQTLSYECSVLAQAHDRYDNTLLEQAGDMLLGTAGGGQPCYGDSGGPLLRANEAGELVAYGVVSGGVESHDLTCDRGAVYAGFAGEVMSFLDEQLRWKDPCESVPLAGLCSGEVARRCTTTAEGKRRVTELDCTTLGLHCIDSPKGVDCREH